MTRAESIRWLFGTMAMMAVWFFDSISASILAIALIAVFGLPHGAADAFLIKKYWPGRFIWFFMLLAYALVVILFACFFFQFPAMALAIFILVSIWHFGAQDSDGLPRWSVPGAGGIFIFGPFVCWGAQIDIYLSQLGLAESSRFMLLEFSPWLFAICATLVFAAALQKRNVSKAALIGFALSLPVALFLPPLLSFSLYFCLLHAPRHLASSKPEMPKWWRSPAVTGALVLTWAAAAIWIFYGDAKLISERTTAALIIGMAALTVPHMLLNFILARKDAVNHCSVVSGLE
jgi:beta-carotene 15,15'-dioxygenase